MTKELFIHVGAGKTGTTALQEFFYTNQRRLKKKGVTIADIGVVRSGNSITHHRLADWGVHAGSDYLSLWREIAALDDQRILLSSEYFHSRISEGDGLDFFAGIRDLFFDRKIRIVFYIRRQSEWLQSAYEQWVKANTLSLTIEQFATSYKKNLSDQVFRFAEVFGRENIIVRPYERNRFKDNSIYADFFQILGIDIDRRYRHPKGNVNPRLSADALHFKRLFNAYSRDKGEARLVQADLRKYSELVSEPQSDNAAHARSNMPGELQRAIEEKNRENYETIATKFLGRENGLLFSEEPDYSDDTKDGTQPTDNSDLYPYLFLEMYKKIQLLTKRNEELALKLERMERRG